MKIITVIPLYNPENKTQLSNLVKNLKLYSDVLFVINDGNQVYLGQDFTSQPTCNKGTSGAYNIAINEYLDNYEYLWLWDQDSYADNELLGEFIKTVNTYKHLDKCGIFSFYDKHNQVESNNILSMTLNHAKSSGTLISKSTIKKVGLFDEALFLDYADYEYIRRAKYYGIHTTHFPNLELSSHTLGGKYGSLFGNLNAPAPIRLFYQKIGALYILKLQHFPLSYKLKLLLRILAWTPYSLIFHDRRKRIHALWCQR
jgi:GT2 family glycosyltransferase